ncbi:MAG TPA: Crp/Fnr family transcriptional regulator [Terriglobia bacterium]|nr:Crp/Fnr family transcriptional regulator [Terriglobia bacterium]
MTSMLTNLASIPLFAGLRRDEVAAVVAAASKRIFKGSDIIMSAEEPATRLFLVTGGHVDYFVLTSHGNEILLRRMVPHDVFGVAAFLSNPIGYLGTAKPAPKGEVLEWQRPVVLRLANAYPRFPENALRISLQYIALIAKRHAQLVSSTAAERLASAVTGLACRAGHALPSGVEVDIKNEELASLSDTSSFTASRILKRWEREGTVEKTRGKVLLRRPENLL